MSDNQQPQPPEESSRMDALVKVVLVFFISLLSFSVGTFVGKQVSDSDHRRASLEGGHGEKTEEHAAAEGAHGEAAGEHGEATAEHAEGAEAEHDVAAATEHEVEDLASEFVQEGRGIASEHPAPAAKDAKADANGYASYERKGAQKADAHGAPPAVLPARPTEAQPQTPAAEKHAPAAKPAAKSEASDAAKKISQGEAPTTGEKVAAPRKPSNVLPAAASPSAGKYTVQVASYGSEDEAKAFAAKLKAKGWNAFYIPAEIKGTTWYRVSVGLFEQSANAQAFKSQFLKESGTKDALVVKIVQ